MRHLHSRRDFMKHGLISVSAFAHFPPMTRVVEMMIKDIISQNSHAEESADLFYMPVFLFGAPARWVFDHFLACSNAEMGRFIGNPMVATTLTNQGQSTSYTTIDYKGVRVPPLWDYVVPTKGGAKLSSLLDHLLVFRGYGSGVDGHINNSALQLSPISSSGSISGVVGDSSQTLFRAIQSSRASYTGFHSPKGYGLTVINYNANENLVLTLLKAFRKKSENQNLDDFRKNYKAFYDNAKGALKVLSQTLFGTGDSLIQDHVKAMKKIESATEDLNSVWNSLFTKYQLLLLAAYKDKSSGISASPVIVSSDPGSEINPWAVGGVNNETIYPQIGLDLRTTVNNINIDQIAAEFALAEYVATRRLSRVFEMSLFGPPNIVVPTNRTLEAGTLVNTELRTFSFVFDQHTTGSISTAFYNSLFFRSLGVGLFELVSVLKASNLFNKSFLQIVTEFGRTPRNSQGGSDHGFDAMISSVFTGLNNSKPIVVGNILRQGGRNLPSNITGTFGQKAPTRVGSDNLELTPASVASTLATIMNLPHNPWKNVANPLITLNSGSLSVNSSGDLV